MSRILCIIDGMIDPGFLQKDFKNLSSMSLSQYIDTVGAGRAESLNCILHLLGVSDVPKDLRGYVEAVAEGIPLCEDDLIFRGSWFSADEAGLCKGPMVGPKQLVSQSGSYRYYFIEQYKAILVFTGLAHLVDEVVTYPPYSCTGAKVSSYRPKGCPELEHCFDEWAQDGKCLIPWGQAVPSKLPKFPQKAAAICKASVVKGIARLMGMELVDVPGATGETDTDLGAKAAAALEAAKSYPFVLLHINGADEAAHRCSAEEKHSFIEKVDEAVLGPLLSSGHEVMVAGDHGTDPQTGEHTGGMQPCFTNYKI